MLKRFLKDSAGNMAIMFSLTTAVLIAGVGAAVDFSYASKQTSVLQGMIDSATLAAAHSRKEEVEDLQAIVDAVIAEHNREGWPVSATVSIVNDEINVTADMSYNTQLMGVFGMSDLPIQVSAGAPIGSKTPINLALVLDTTQSMASDGNMAALQTAARAMLDEFATADAPIRVSIIPFGEYVNIGTGRKGEPWLDVDDDGLTKTEMVTYTPQRVITASVCTGTGVMVTHDNYNDGVFTGTSTYEEQSCTPAVTEDLPPVTEPRTTTYTWFGCAGSRAAPNNLQAEYGATRIPGVMNISCGQELRELTKVKENLNALKNDIASLTASGSTYLPSGLMWGWRTLNKNAPLTHSHNSNGEKKIVDAILFMTDGGNTKSQYDIYHSGNDKDAGITQTATLCEAVKASGIQIFTVAYNFPGDADATKAMLESCASASDQAFDPDNSSQLLANFKEISKQLQNVRLAY